ncbi:hypothetical protein BV898_09559 [Hypsibius exemplaris]|uniref:Uncharacterized protein n=1 Tax=Hypsibius exemplaris TaxID=2072580 RepID=A0A1W0WM08_HYPEX|nr:hypothetical protein BV898_09559 [Hypsibius exemplaris]
MNVFSGDWLRLAERIWWRRLRKLNCPHVGVYVKSSKETWFSLFGEIHLASSTEASTGDAAAPAPVAAATAPFLVKDTNCKFCGL